MNYYAFFILFNAFFCIFLHFFELIKNFVHFFKICYHFFDEIRQIGVKKGVFEQKSDFLGHF